LSSQAHHGHDDDLRTSQSAGKPITCLVDISDRVVHMISPRWRPLSPGVEVLPYAHQLSARAEGGVASDSEIPWGTPFADLDLVHQRTADVHERAYSLLRHAAPLAPLAQFVAETIQRRPVGG